MIPVAANDAATLQRRLTDNAFNDPESGRTTPTLPLTLGASAPHLTQIPWAHPSLHPKRHLDRFGRFCMGPKCYDVQCIVNGLKTPKITYSSCDFVTPPEKDGATAHRHRQHAQKLVKIARVVREICWRTDRQTHTQTHSLQYFATAASSK